MPTSGMSQACLSSGALLEVPLMKVISRPRPARLVALSLITIGAVVAGNLPASATVPPPSSCRLRRDPVIFVAAVSCTITAQLDTAVVAGMVFDPATVEEATTINLVPPIGASFAGPGVNKTWGRTTLLRDVIEVTVGESYTLTLYSPYGSASVVTDTNSPALDRIGTVGFVVTYDIHTDGADECTDVETCEAVVEGVIGCYAQMPLDTDKEAELGSGYLRLHLESWCQLSPGLQIGPTDIATPYARHLQTHKNVTFHRPLQAGEDELSAYNNAVTGYGRLFWKITANNTWSDQHLCPQAIGPLLDGGNNPPPEAYPGDDPTCLTLRSPSALDPQFSAPLAGEDRAIGVAEAPCGGAAVPEWWTTNGDNNGSLGGEYPCNGLWHASGRAFFTPGLAIGTDQTAIVKPKGYEPLDDPGGESYCEPNQVVDPTHPNRELQTVDCFMFSQKAVTVV